MDNATLILLYLIVNQMQQDDESAGSAFKEQLTLASRRLRQGKIRRGALLHPSQSAFSFLFHSGHDDALVTLCGFDHASFAAIHQRFEPLFDNNSPYTNDGRRIRQHNRNFGGRRLITSTQGLALVLAWTRTQGSFASLQLIFGFTPGRLSLWLRFGIQMLLRILSGDPLAIPTMPSNDELDDFVSSITAKYPALTNCWGAMDGLKIRLQKSGNAQVQNLFYNGWTHDHYISNLFLFSPDGKIRACYTNAPGTMHDSTLAKWGGLYDKIDELYRTRQAKVVVDSAFASDKRDSVYKSYQCNMDNNGNVRQNSIIQRQATSVRQLSEWGMRGLQASFPRLKDRMPYEEKGARRLTMRLIVYLYNYRAAVVGMNQIQSVFMPWLERNATKFING
jgi:DDE superfamily endonuclease